VEIHHLVQQNFSLATKQGKKERRGASKTPKESRSGVYTEK